MSLKLVVTGFGYSIRHVVEVELDDVEDMYWISDFHGIRTPVKALCGKTVRSIQNAVVVMKPYPPTCEVCKYITRDQTLDNHVFHPELQAQ